MRRERLRRLVMEGPPAAAYGARGGRNLAADHPTPRDPSTWRAERPKSGRSPPQVLPLIRREHLFGQLEDPVEHDALLELRDSTQPALLGLQHRRVVADLGVELVLAGAEEPDGQHLVGVVLVAQDDG